METSKSLATDPGTGGDCGGNNPCTTANLLADLARVKAIFQLRAIKAVIEGPAA